jgi:hypothetical protein
MQTKLPSWPGTEGCVPNPQVPEQKNPYQTIIRSTGKKKKKKKKKKQTKDIEQNSQAAIEDGPVPKSADQTTVAVYRSMHTKPP